MSLVSSFIVAGEAPAPDAASLAQLVRWAKEAAKARAATFKWDPSGCTPAMGRPSAAVARPESPAPLNVVLADPKNSLFHAMRDPRVTISGVADARALAPDVLVLNANSMKRLSQSAAAVPDELWRHVAGKGSRLVFDSSGEGLPHDPVRTDALHDLLRAKGIDPARAAYITQTRSFPAEYDAYCDALGVDDRRMSVWLYDRFIQLTFAPFHETGELEFAQRLARYASAGRRRSRRYICFNKLMRPHRTVFLLRLLQRGLWDQGFVSMGLLGEGGQAYESKEAFISSLRSWTHQGKPSPDLLLLLDELLPLIDELLQRDAAYIALDRSTPGKQTELAKMIRASAIQECADSWFTVVPESEFYDRPHRITEKPFKALLNFHPLIVLGSVGSLRLIRSYGFETYPEFFDESYDDEADPLTRFGMVFDQVERLCRLDEAEIARLDEAAAAAAVFNAWWGLVELPRLFRSRIDAELVDRLLAL